MTLLNCQEIIKNQYLDNYLNLCWQVIYSKMILTTIVTVYSPENNVALYEILPNENSHYILGLYNNYVCTYNANSMAIFSPYIWGRVVIGVVLFSGLYGIWYTKCVPSANFIFLKRVPLNRFESLGLSDSKDMKIVNSPVDLESEKFKLLKVYVIWY